MPDYYYVSGKEYINDTCSVLPNRLSAMKEHLYNPCRACTVDGETLCDAFWLCFGNVDEYVLATQEQRDTVRELIVLLFETFLDNRDYYTDPEHPERLEELRLEFKI